ncbi:MAG: HAMP domain-containing histidine kinase [Clostridia bacterium]|nr:HAMP domain-containing histidine kinase [Clostridia bacterium]
MIKPRLGVAKSLRRKLTNQYLGIFTIVYFLLLLIIMITRVEAEYLNTRDHLTDSVYKKIHNEEPIISAGEYYKDGYEQYILSYAEYRVTGDDAVFVDGEGSIPEYDFLKNFKFFNSIRYFTKTGDTIFNCKNYSDDNRTMFITFDLFNYSLDNVFFGELLILLITFIVIYLIGVLLFVSIGNAKAKKALKPIHDLTALTSSINENNLNLRIDVESARYELKELCITLNSMLDRIEKVYMKQKTFVSDVSHELRTPISVIDGYVNMLKRWGSSDQVVLDESIEAILSETKNMKELVEALLFLARYDNHSIKYESEELDISGLLEDVYRETKLMDKDNHHLSIDIQEGLICLGDYNKIKECLRIFIDNSLKYTPPGKDIHLNCKESDKYIIITIKDKGIGISKDHLKNIFNRFYRVETSRAKETGGSGLGLPIARAIILAHNGKIRLFSKEGSGTTIEILLPKVIA